MKKFIYLCGMMLITINIMAQIDPYDRNWDTVFFDDFSGNRYWDRHWDDSTGIPGYKPLWRCFSYNLWKSGVTKYDKQYPNYAAYQRSNAVFGPDGTLKLVGEFKTIKNMACGRNSISDTTYSPAPWRKYCHYCDDPANQDLVIHYYTGMIESTDSLGYGYYEIRCKMPVHPGTHDAFWFWGDYGTYEEIDVFEHGADMCAGNIEKGFNSGIFYNPDGPNYLPIMDSVTNEELFHGAYNYSHISYLTPTTSQPLSEYHTYGCLWLPERIAWYFDGELFKEETDPTHIPQHPMWLKITHHLDNHAIFGSDTLPDWWRGTDEMVIDYVKHYKLKTDCDTNTVLRNNADFDGFHYSVKRSIAMGGQSGSTLSAPNNTTLTFRAVDSIIIDGPFEVPQGTEMTLIIQECPECSQDGVHSQTYCPH